MTTTVLPEIPVERILRECPVCEDRATNTVLRYEETSSGPAWDCNMTFACGLIWGFYGSHGAIIKTQCTRAQTVALDLRERLKGVRAAVDS